MPMARLRDCLTVLGRVLLELIVIMSLTVWSVLRRVASNLCIILIHLL